jgi:hypothetical protein
MSLRAIAILAVITAILAVIFRRSRHIKIIPDHPKKRDL